jgi:hypothetical protein
MRGRKSLWHKGLRFPAADPVSNALDTGCAIYKLFRHKELRLARPSGVPVSKGGVVCTTSRRHKGLQFPSTDPLSNGLDTGCTFCKLFIHKELRLARPSSVPLSKGGAVHITHISAFTMDHRYFGVILLDHKTCAPKSAARHFEF